MDIPRWGGGWVDSKIDGKRNPVFWVIKRCICPRLGGLEGELPSRDKGDAESALVDHGGIN